VTRGAHTFKSGIHYQTTVDAPTSGRAAVFTFGALPAADGRGAVSALDQYQHAIAGDIDSATGRPYTDTQLSQDLGEPSVSLRFHFVNLFTQDEWRLSAKLIRFPIALQAGVQRSARQLRQRARGWGPAPLRYPL
jgi:hypothetical protein